MSNAHDFHRWENKWKRRSNGETWPRKQISLYHTRSLQHVGNFIWVISKHYERQFDRVTTPSNIYPASTDSTLTLTWLPKIKRLFVISNFRSVVNVFFLLGGSPAFEFSVTTFRNNVCFIVIDRLKKKNYSCFKDLWILIKQGVPKRRHMKFRRRGIAQKKE
jgi:hypothetical protein